MSYRLGFIGAGNMAEAIAAAAIRAGVLSPAQMIAADPNPDRRAVFATMGIETSEDNVALVSQSEQVLLAIKPQMLEKVVTPLAVAVGPQHVLISIMAGIGSAKLERVLGKKARVVRVMPNTPVMVGEGMAGIAVGMGTEPGDDELAYRLFSAAGKAVRVQEKALDAITAVSGSGPAYVFYLAEAMERAAKELGLGKDAAALVAQTLVGAAKLLAQSPDSAAELRRKVTSPGGTTEAAINLMQSAGVGDAICTGIKAAQTRSRELGA